MSIRSFNLTRRSALLLISLVSLTQARAATQYWDISNASGLTVGAGIWSTSTADTYWATSASPGTTAPTFWTDGNDAMFQQGGTDTVTLNGTVNVNSINTLNNTTAGTSVTIASGTSPLLVIGAGGIKNLGNGLLSITAPVQLGTSQTWDAGSAGGTGITVGGVISEASSGLSLTKTGFNTLTLNGASANTYTGATVINGGTLLLNMGSMATATNLINSASALNMGGGILTLTGKASAAASQTFGNVTLSANGGQNTINVNATGTTTSLTLGNTWNRSAGSSLNIVTFGTSITTPVLTGVGLTNGIIGGYATFSNGTSSSFATVSSGQIAAVATTGVTNTTTGSALNGSISSSLTHDSGDWSLNSLALNGAGLDIGGGVLTLSSGGLLHRGTATGGDVISNGQLGASGSEVIIHTLASASRTLEVSGTVSGGAGSLTKGGSRTLILTGNNSYTGNTVIGAGTLQIGNGGTTGSIANSANVIVKGGTSLANGAVLAYNRTDASSVNNLTGGGNLLVNSGTLTLLQSGSGLTLGTVGGLTGSTIVFGGDGTGVTSIGNAGSTSINSLAVAGQTYKFNSGTINLLDGGRGFASNIEVNGATLNLNNNFSMAGVVNGTQTLTITAGTINVPFSFGASGLNGNGGPSTAGTANSTFVANQSGGLFSITAAQGRFDLGNITVNNSTTYNLSGGTILHTGSTGGFNIGADGSGTSTTSFNFSGGKIIENTVITGGIALANVSTTLTTSSVTTPTLATASSVTGLAVGQLITGTNIAPGTTITAINTSTKVITMSVAATGSGTNTTAFTSDPKQSFVWTGGTLATFRYDATNLTSTSGTAVTATTNTLTNGGGILAPGDIGTTGKTTVTGKYAVTSPNAILSIDLGGATASSVFQDAAAAGKFDLVAVTQTAVLGGKLNVNFIDGYGSTVSNATNHKILTTAAAGLSGTFTNTVTGSTASGGASRVVLADGLSSFRVNYGTADVTLGAYLANNEFTGAGSTWSSTNNWTAFAPSLAGHVAKFADGPAAGAVAVNLDVNETVAGVQFASTTRNYTVGGSSTLTLDNNGTASNITSVGTQAITVPVALNNDLNVATTSGTLAISGGISGSGKVVNKSGSGTLNLGGTNTYTGATNVNGGVLLVNGSVASSAVNVNSGGTLGGSGTISGAVVVNSGGTLSAGNSPGVLSGGSLDLNSGSNSLFEINGTTRGSQYDGFNSASTVDFDGTLTLSFGNVSNYANTDVFDLFNFSTTSTGDFTSLTSTGFYSGSWFKTGDIWELASGGQTLQFSELTGDMTFVIPEPSTYAMLASGLVALAFLRRKKRS